MAGKGVQRSDGRKSPTSPAFGAFPPRRRKTAYPILDDIATRAKVLIGEIDAGNTSLHLRNELSRIVLPQYKNKRITRAEYRRFAKL